MSAARRRRGSWQHGALARCAHAATALLAASGLLSSLYLGWTFSADPPFGAGFTGGFAAGWEHMLNQPSYFTFLSALMVCVTSAMLAFHTGRDSAVFHAVRVAAVACVIITGVVFNLLLRGEANLTGIWWFNDTVLHVLLPVLAPLVWLGFGPHGKLTGRITAASMVIPVTWLAVTLVRGPALDWYPYIILDVPRMGYAGVAVYIVSILGGYLALACALWGLDRVLSRNRPG